MFNRFRMKPLMEAICKLEDYVKYTDDQARSRRSYNDYEVGIAVGARQALDILLDVKNKYEKRK